MNTVKDILWTIASLFELFDRHKIYLELKLLVELSDSDLHTLQKQTHQKAIQHSAAVEFFYHEPLLSIRIAQGENVMESDTQPDSVQKARVSFLDG